MRLRGWIIALIFILVFMYVASGRKTSPNPEPFRVTTTPMAPGFTCPIPGTC